MDVLITAGATRNPVDAIRYLSAHSTGRTGVAIGEALRARGAAVTLLGSAEARLRALDLPGEEYTSTRDLLARMERWVRAHPDGAVIHAAAVGDYEVPDALTTKIPSKMPKLVIELVPAPKIADLVRGWGLRGIFVTFKAASPETTDDQLVAIAAAQRERVGCDLVFANVIGRLSRRVALVGREPRWFEDRGAAIEALVGAVIA
jgi:phosphopantothenoylcysteine decarboxylase/phosphopantothenate--cysteine ligase